MIRFITMSDKKAFPASLFGVAFIAALLLAAPQSHAAMQTFEKEYTYIASELDSKSSCRAIALEQVKRILLQELGVYVESVFSDKASSDGRTPDEVRREITTLSAGVASTEVMEEKWDGTTYWLRARIKADPDDVAKKIEALRQDKQKVAELEESRKRAAELSLELERMRNELDATKSAAAKAEQSKKYSDTAQHLSAVDWFNKGYAFFVAKQDGKAIEAYSKAIELDAEDGAAYLLRGFAYGGLGDNKRAIEDYNKAIELKNPEYWDAYLYRGSAYRDLGDYRRAIEDYSRALELKPKEWDAYYNRGKAYADLGDNNRAIEDYSRALELKPKGMMGEVYKCRGSAYRDLGDYRRAIEDYSRVIELMPTWGGAMVSAVSLTVGLATTGGRLRITTRR